MLQRANKTRLLRIAVLGAVFIAAWFWQGEGVSLCLFHHLTGLECPGCGMTRGFYAISHGDFSAAINYNVFSPALYFFFMAVLLSDIVYLTTGRHITLRVPERIEQVSGYTALFLVLAYGVLRNIIPIEEFI